MNKIEPVKRKEITEIQHFGIDEMLDVFRFEKMKADTARDQIYQSTHRNMEWFIN